jgi:hypothetical protein
MLIHMEVRMLFAKLVSGVDCGISSTHPLAFAGQLYHRVIVNQEQTTRVARQLRLDPEACRGVVRMLKGFGQFPSCERLAVICQLDRGLTDADVGEVFGRTAEWSSQVRENTHQLRQDEPLEARLEWYDPDFKPFDPAPVEIYERALEIRSSRGVARMPSPGIRTYHWKSNATSFIPIRPE